MEECLLNYFIFNNEIKSSCDFKPEMYSRGHTVYEVVRIIQQKPLFLEDHVERFFHSLHLSKIPVGISVSELINSLKTLIECNQLINGNIRFQFGYAPHNQAEFLAIVIPANYPSADTIKNGVKVLSLEAERENPNVKCDYLSARQNANKILKESDVFEVLLINKQGFITEGSRSNVFCITENNLITPPLSDVLPGVTRSKILQLAKQKHIMTIEKQIPFSEIQKFDNVFLCGTSIKILAINKIDNTRFSTTGPILHELEKSYDELIKTYLQKYSC